MQAMLLEQGCALVLRCRVETVASAAREGAPALLHLLSLLLYRGGPCRSLAAAAERACLLEHALRRLLPV